MTKVHNFQKADQHRVKKITVVIQSREAIVVRVPQKEVIAIQLATSWLPPTIEQKSRLVTRKD